MRQIRGYMVEVEWDGATLRARGTNKAAQVALRGQQRNEGDLVLAVDQIDRADYKSASALVNGKITLHSDGDAYQLHFRKKQAGEFRQLAEELGASV